MRTTLKKLFKVFGIIFVLIVIVSVVYIMANGIGLIDSLDFGAGAYYYADIPEFYKYVNGDHFKSAFPMYVYIGLFLLWGAIIYKLWVFLDKKL